MRNPINFTNGLTGPETCHLLRNRTDLTKASVDYGPQGVSALESTKKIISLQQQMSNQILAMAETVETLLDHVSPREARAFMRVAFGMAASDLATYIKFSKTLKGSKEILQKGRVSFSVVRSMVGADEETRKV